MRPLLEQVVVEAGAVAGEEHPGERRLLGVVRG